MVSATSKKTLILSFSALAGILTVSTLAYLLIQDDRRAKHQRKVRSLQKTLSHKLHKVEASIQELIDGDIRLAQVRTKTLRTHPIYPGDPHVKLPSLGLINDNDKQDLGQDIHETAEELTRERSQGYGEDTQKVRQGYKRLDFLIASINERLLRLLESLDGISPRELTDLGDGSGRLAASNGPEVQAFEKIRRRKRADIEKIQKLMGQMDKVAGTFKDRLEAIEIYEKKAEEAAVEAAEEEKERAKKDAQANLIIEEKQDKVNGEGLTASHHEHSREHSVESSVVKEGLSFAEVASHHVEEKEVDVLKHTEDLEKMKEGIIFAEVVSHSSHQEHSDASSISTSTTTTTTTISSSTESLSSSGVIVNGDVHSEEHTHLEKVTEGISFADVVAHHATSAVEEHKQEALAHKEEVLEETEDLEKMKSGITFADVVSHQTEAKEEVNGDINEEVNVVKDVVKDEVKDEVKQDKEVKSDQQQHSYTENTVLEPTEDLEKMKEGLSFAAVVAEGSAADEEGQQVQQQQQHESSPVPVAAN